MKSEEAYLSSVSVHLQKHEDKRTSFAQATKKVLSYYILPVLIALLSIPLYWKINPLVGYLCFFMSIAVAVYILNHYSGLPYREYEAYYFKHILPILFKNYEINSQFSDHQQINQQQLHIDFDLPDAYYIRTSYLLKGHLKQLLQYQVSNIEIGLNDTESMLFDGLLYEIDISYPFEAEVLMLPKSKNYKWLRVHLSTEHLQPVKGEASLQKITKQYHIYANTAEVATFVLKPSLMQAIGRLKKRRIVLKVINNKAFMWVPALKLPETLSLNEALNDQHIKPVFHQIEALYAWLLSFADSESDE